MTGVKRVRLSIVLAITFAAVLIAACISVSLALWAGGAKSIEEGGNIGEFYIEYPASAQLSSLEKDEHFDATKNYAVVYRNGMLDFYALTPETNQEKALGVLLQKGDKVFYFSGYEVQKEKFTSIDEYSSYPGEGLGGSISTDRLNTPSTNYNCYVPAFDGWFDLYFKSDGSLYFSSSAYVNEENWEKKQEGAEAAFIEQARTAFYANYKYKATINYYNGSDTTDVAESVKLAFRDSAVHLWIYSSSNYTGGTWPGLDATVAGLTVNIPIADKDNVRIIFSHQGTYFDQTPGDADAWYLKNKFPSREAVYYTDFNWQQGTTTCSEAVFTPPTYTPAAYPGDNQATPTRSSISLDRSDDMIVREVEGATDQPTYQYTNFVSIYRKCEGGATTLAYINFKIDDIVYAGGASSDDDCKFVANDSVLVRRRNTTSAGAVQSGYNGANLVVYNAPDGKNFTAPNMNGTNVDGNLSNHTIDHVSGGAYVMLYFGQGVDQYYALEVTITTTKKVDSFKLTAWAANADWRHKYRTGLGEPLGYYLGGTFNGVGIWEPRDAMLFEKSYNFPEKNVSMTVDGTSKPYGPNYIDIQKTVRLVTSESVEDKIKLYRLDDKDNVGTREGGEPTLWFLPNKLVLNYTYNGQSPNTEVSPKFDSSLNTIVGTTGVYYIRYAGDVTYWTSGATNHVDITHGIITANKTGAGHTSCTYADIQAWNGVVEKLYIGKTSLMETNKLTVAFDLNGGTYDSNSSIASQEMYWAHTYRESGNTLPDEQKLAKPGASFAGWYTNDGTDGDWGTRFYKYDITDSTPYDHDAQYDKIRTEGFTLYAKWTSDNYTLTLNANGNDTYPANFPTVTDTPATTTVQAPNGEAYSLASVPTPARTGWEFDGWYTAATGGDKVTSVTLSADGAVYAQWKPIVTFDANGGAFDELDGTPTTFTQSVAVGGTITIDAEHTPSRTGYSLTGWKSGNATTGAAWTPGTTTVSVPVTVYAQWVTTYTITFNGNGGTIDSATTKDVQVNTGDTIADADIPTPDSRTGYLFAGWWTANGASDNWGTKWDKAAETATVYARWSAIQNGIYADNIFVAAATSNYVDGTNSNNGRVRFKIYAAHLTGGQTLTFYWNNYLVYYDYAMFVRSGCSTDIKRNGTSSSELIVKEGKSGYYDFYFDNWDNSSGHPTNNEQGFWVAKWSDYTDIGGVTPVVNGVEGTLIPFTHKLGNINQVYTGETGIVVGNTTGTDNNRYTYRVKFNNANATVTTLDLSAATLNITHSGADIYLYAGTYKIYYSYAKDANNDGPNRVYISGTRTGSDATVTFDGNGGTITGTASYTGYNGQEIAVPTVSKTGYEFGGWASADHTIADGTTKYNINGTETFTAQWSATKYTVNFYNNHSPSDTTRPTGGTLNNVSLDSPTVTLPDVSRTGYVFGGWYKDRTATTNKWEATTLTAALITTYASGTTIDLYAHWTAITYNVTYVLDNGTVSGGTNPASFTVETSGYPFTSLIKASKNYYTADGWKDGSNNTVTAFNDTYVASLGADSTTVSITLTAQYTPTTYTVTAYDKNAADATMPAGYKSSFTAADAVGDYIDLPAPTRSEYRFLGWKANSTDTPFKKIAKSTIISGNVVVAKLTAEWQSAPSSFTVTFKNGGSTVATYTVAAGSTIAATSGASVPTLTPAAVDYGTLDYNWTYGSNTYTAAQAEALAINDDVTFTAAWTATHTVTLQGNGGKWGDDTSKAITVVHGYAITALKDAHKPTRSHHELSGWKSGDATFDFTTTITTDGVTLTAQWNALTYLVVGTGASAVETQMTEQATATSGYTSTYTLTGKTMANSDVVSFITGDDTINVKLVAGSTGAHISGKNATAQSSITMSRAGTFEFRLDYKSDASVAYVSDGHQELGEVIESGKYYLVGTMSGKDTNWDYLGIKSDASTQGSGNKASFTLHLTNGDTVKGRQAGTGWSEDTLGSTDWYVTKNSSNNAQVNLTGDYTVYWSNNNKLYFSCTASEYELYTDGGDTVSFSGHSTSNEVKITGLFTGASGTSYKLRYNGSQITGFSIKGDSQVPTSWVSNNTLNLPARNKIDIYYNTSTKVMYIGYSEYNLSNTTGSKQVGLYTSDGIIIFELKSSSYTKSSYNFYMWTPGGAYVSSSNYPGDTLTTGAYHNYKNKAAFSRVIVSETGGYKCTGDVTLPAEGGYIYEITWSAGSDISSVTKRALWTS